MNRAHRSGRVASLFLAAALPLSVLGCQAPPVNAAPKPPSSRSTTSITTYSNSKSNSSSVTSVSKNGKTKTEVKIQIDDHPEIKRTFDFPVEVTTNTVTVKGVGRTEVVIKKPTGELVEKVLL